MGLRFKNMAEFEAFKSRLGISVHKTIDGIVNPQTPLRVGPRPDTDELQLNKTERARLAHLRAMKMPCLNIQAITLKLAHDCRLTVDFTYVTDGVLVFEDVKGSRKRPDGSMGYWAEEDSKIKLKMAARSFPEFRFLVAYKDKGAQSGWSTEDVKP